MDDALLDEAAAEMADAQENTAGVSSSPASTASDTPSRVPAVDKTSAMNESASKDKVAQPAELVSQANETKEDEAQEQPPPGLSKAQKILNGGSNRMELLTGSRDAVAKDSVAEFRNEAETLASNDGGKASPSATTSATSPEEPPMARWEQRWNKSAEKAPVVELPSSPPVESTRSVESGTDEGAHALRQRKPQGDKAEAGSLSSQSKAASAGSIDNAGSAEAGSFDAIREKMRRDRLGLWEFWIRQAILVFTALCLAWYFSQVGGLSIPSDDTAVIEVASIATPGDEDADEIKLSFGDDEDLETGTGAGAGAGANSRFSQDDLEPMMIPSLAGGYLSIPVGVFLFRAALHLLVAMGAGIPFSLVESARYPLQAKANEGGLLSRFAGFVPLLSQALETSGLMRAIMDDALLFVCVFVTATSALHLLL
ncbi:Hypothetical Protein FCC1311_032602 [Hondaea fermentalgiana]|uniref:Uncharacterized protein n=1 Tax=Hondaea fermentalgiana TaxID=2315210 RepID=A0A2R5G7M0_9STRA|nr:Hypothetical Protein FCC1311_032602 [Hondaea fermentalgiana]|eukprot:GBG27037.1 Hypothetical Protein FCC1311_032602 [Hondaea fermentalgiana]